MASLGTVDALMLFGFIKKLTDKYTSWDAYKSGVLDRDGNIVIAPEDRDSRQKRSFRKFDLLVLRIRKLLEKIPGGTNRFLTFSAALFLIREGKDKPTEEILNEILAISEEKETIQLFEEVANSVGDGSAIAGVNNPPARRRTRFAGREVFDVDMGTVMRSRFGKKSRARYSKYLDENEHSDIIDFCRKNPKTSVLLRDKKTGSMIPFKN